MTKSNKATNISVLPEGCISEILSLTSPRDACRAASISKLFNLAADSDAVWERFLPPDYRDVIATAVSPVVFESKKQLYHRLSESHILLDRGNLGFKLDKESGRKCYMLGARNLYIVWGDDTRYWRWRNVLYSRFSEVAILREVWWFHIEGRIASVKLSPKTTYVAYLVYRISRNSFGLSGLGKTIVTIGGVRNEISNVFLEQVIEMPHVERRIHAPTPRNDGWIEIKLGEFYYDEGDEGDVWMVFEEHEGWKGGLVVEGIEIRPK